MGAPFGVMYPGTRARVTVGNTSTLVSAAGGPRPLAIYNSATETIHIQTGAAAVAGSCLPLEQGRGQVFDTDEAVYAICASGGMSITTWQGYYVPTSAFSGTINVDEVDLGTTAANTARTTATKVLCVQEVAADGTVPPSGSLATNPQFVRLADGTNAISTTNPVPTRPSADGTNPVDGTHPLPVQHGDGAGHTMPAGDDPARPIYTSAAIAGTVALSDLDDANTARAVTTHVLPVQMVGADGTVPPTGSLATNPQYVRPSNGVAAAEISAANTARAVGTIVQAMQHVDSAGLVQPSGADAVHPMYVAEGLKAGLAAVALTPVPQDLTAGWVRLGNADISCAGYSKIALFFTLDINDSLNPRIRLIARHTASGTDHVLYIRNAATGTDVKLNPEYFEVDTDVDQSGVVSWDLDGLVTECKIEVQAGTVGATAGQIDAAAYILRA